MNPLLNRRVFLWMVAAGAAVAAVIGGVRSTAAAPEFSNLTQVRTSKSPSNLRSGHLYMQTNEIRNAVVHYRWSPSGALTEVGRVPTGGAGSGTFKPISGQENAANAFEGAGSVILSPDRRLLFVTNGGDNSVSSFSVDEGGGLRLINVESTGNPVKGKSGTAKSLVYAPAMGVLFVLHSFGPDHLRLMSVDREGKVALRPERYTVNTKDKTERVPTMAALSPDGKFLLVGTVFDLPPVLSGQYPDGSPIIWVKKPDGTYKVIATNAPDPDGLVVFPVRDDGTLGPASFQDAQGASPFYISFLHGRPDTFVVGYAVSNGVSIGHLDPDGTIHIGKVVQIDASAGRPSELCWLSVSSDDRFVFTTNFGYSTISSYRIDGNALSIAKDPASPKVSGDGTFRAVDGVVSSGPSDSWLTPDGTYLYQIYANASTLIGYATRPDGSLQRVSSVKIPYNSPQGLAGFRP